MDARQAEALALQCLTKIAEDAGVLGRVGIDSSLTRAVAGGWLVSWNSTEFLRSRRGEDAMAGNGPFFVRSEGTVEQFGSSMSLDEIAQDLARRANRSGGQTG